MKEIVGYMFDAMEFPTVEFLNKLEELRSKYISFGIGQIMGINSLRNAMQHPT